jgi:hypothetical protein
MVFKEQLGVELPDWKASADTIAASVRALSGHIDEEIREKRAVEIADPIDFDIAIATTRGLHHHMGIYIAGGILHAARGYHSRWDRLDIFCSMHHPVRFFRWPI